jgi:hypothetical protein
MALELSGGNGSFSVRLTGKRSSIGGLCDVANERRNPASIDVLDLFQQMT